MSFVLKLNKLEYIESIRAAIRAEGWTGVDGCKEWAKKTYDATLNYNCYRDMSSIKFKTEEACQAFAKEYKIPYLTNVQKYQADPRFQLLADMNKLLNGDRIWGGMEWTYHPIHPLKYRPMTERVEQALDELKAEYGVKE